MGKSVIYYIKMKGVKYAFRCQDENYKGLEKGLGVVKAKDTEDGLVFGANRPKPATVRINFEGGGSTKRFCDPTKLEDVIVNGSLNNKKVSIPGLFNNKKISSVTAAR